MAFEGHEQGVIRQPSPLLRPKGRLGFPIPLPAPGKGLAQQAEALLVQPAVIHRPRRRQVGLHLLLQQKPLRHQQIQVDKVGIPRAGRK